MNDDGGRRAEREPMQAEIDCRRAGERRYRVSILDFSPQGCRLDLVERVLPDEVIWIGLPGIEPLPAHVRWVKDWVAGVEFFHPIHPAVFELVRDRINGLQ